MFVLFQQHMLETVRYQDVVVPELMALMKIGQEFEQGTPNAKSLIIGEVTEVCKSINARL